MIKAEVIAVGSVTQSLQRKQRQNGEFYCTTYMRSAIPTKEGGIQEVQIYLSLPQSLAPALSVPGQRVMVMGTLHFRKEGEQLYFNMQVNEVAQAEAGAPDAITGDLTMIGVVGSRAPEVKSTSKGNRFMTFSAYSGEGEGDARTYTWVRFVRFSADVEDFLVPKALLQLEGNLELQSYQGKVMISSRLNSVKPYIKKAPEGAPF